MGTQVTLELPIQLGIRCRCYRSRKRNASRPMAAKLGAGWNGGAASPTSNETVRHVMSWFFEPHSFVQIESLRSHSILAPQTTHRGTDNARKRTEHKYQIYYLESSKEYMQVSKYNLTTFGFLMGRTSSSIRTVKPFPDHLSAPVSSSHRLPLPPSSQVPPRLLLLCPSFLAPMRG